MKKTVIEMVAELQGAKDAGVEFVTFGDSALDVAVAIDDAIAAIGSMDDDQICEFTWYECDSEGKII